MQGFRQHLQDDRVRSAGVTFLILTALVLATTTASALDISVTSENGEVDRGENAIFNVDIDVKKEDQRLPVKHVKASINEETEVYAIGSGEQNNSDVVDFESFDWGGFDKDYGYGYGYDSNGGEKYYGYGYGYGDGYGYGYEFGEPRAYTITSDVVVDTEGFDTEEHDLTVAVVDTDDNEMNSADASVDVQSTGGNNDDDEEEEEEEEEEEQPPEEDDQSEEEQDEQDDGEQEDQNNQDQNDQNEEEQDQREQVDREVDAQVDEESGEASAETEAQQGERVRTNIPEPVDSDGSRVESIEVTSSSSQTISKSVREVKDDRELEEQGIERTEDQVDVQEINVEGDIEDATVTFSVSKNVLEERGADPSDVVKQRFDPEDQEWQDLETRELEELDDRVRFEADVPEFSYFATTIKTSEETGPVIPWNYLALIAVIAAVIAVTVSEQDRIVRILTDTSEDELSADDVEVMASEEEVEEAFDDAADALREAADDFDHAADIVDEALDKESDSENIEDLIEDVLEEEREAHQLLQHLKELEEK